MFKKDKRGIAILFIFLIIILLLALAFVFSLMSGIANNVMDEFTPVAQGLGVVSSNNLPGDNMSENANYIINPTNSIVNASSWFFGVAYIISLISIISMAYYSRENNGRWQIALFFLLVIASLLLSMAFSNAYQDIYDSNDSLGSELRNQTLLSWLILYSPLVTLIVMLFSATILFTGINQEGGMP